MKPATVTTLIGILENIETCTRLSVAQQLARDALDLIGTPAPAPTGKTGMREKRNLT